MNDLGNATHRFPIYGPAVGSDGAPIASPPIPIELLSQSRHFSLDVNPRVVLSRGPAVELLVKSEVTHYLDFLTLDGMFVVYDDGKSEGPVSDEAARKLDSRFQKVPASKSDVFQHSMGPLDKRRLMKFMQVRFGCVDTMVIIGWLLRRWWWQGFVADGGCQVDFGMFL